MSPENRTAKKTPTPKKEHHKATHSHIPVYANGIKKEEKQKYTKTETTTTKKENTSLKNLGILFLSLAELNKKQHSQEKRVGTRNPFFYNLAIFRRIIKILLQLKFSHPNFTSNCKTAPDMSKLPTNYIAKEDIPVLHSCYRTRPTIPTAVNP